MQIHLTVCFNMWFVIFHQYFTLSQKRHMVGSYYCGLTTKSNGTTADEWVTFLVITLKMQLCVSKRIPDIFICRPYNFSKRYSVLIFGRHFAESRQSKDAIFPPDLICASALPCKTGNMEITSFHSNVRCCFGNRHRAHHNHTRDHIGNALFVKRSAVITKQDQYRT